MQKIRPDLAIGFNIRELRVTRKLTQDMIVAKMQLMGIYISRSSYAKIESNLHCEFYDFFVNLNK